MNLILSGAGRWVVRQKKEWAEILVDYETANQYEICDDTGGVLAFAVERSSGFLGTIARLILRSHRSFEMEVLDTRRAPAFSLRRPAFFLFSSMEVKGAGGEHLGEIHRRFGIVYKRYDLVDKAGRVFSRIKSPFWRLWRFPFYDAQGDTEVGEISKKWGGGLREIFSDADTFLVDVSRARFTPEQQQIALAAAIVVDFDFFEDNDANNRGVFGRLGD